MKMIYLGKNAKALEWSTTEELQEFCAKHGISLGANVVIGDQCCIEGDVHIGSDAWIGYGAHLSYGSIIEDRVRIGDSVTFGRHVRIMADAEMGDNIRVASDTTIGQRSIVGNLVSIGDHTWIKDDNNIGNNVIIGYNASTGDGVHISKNVWVPITTNIPDGHQIERIVTYYNAYQDHASAWIHDDELFIALGEYTQTKDEWDKDFWDNDEFPEGSEQGTRRLEAYHNIVKVGHQIFSASTIP